MIIISIQYSCEIMSSTELTLSEYVSRRQQS